MISESLLDLYTDRQRTFQRQIQDIQQQTLVISWARVLMGIAIAVSIYFGFQMNWLWALSFCAMFIYAYLVNVHEKLKYQITFLQNLIKINGQEIAAQKNDHSSFEKGDEFIENQHPYSLDLDIFGEGSLFQRINRTCTEPGKEKLAGIITKPLNNVQAIQERQSAVKELRDKLDFRQNFQATGMTSAEKKEDQKQLLAWLDLPAFVYGKKAYKLLLITFPLFSAAGLIFWVLSGISAPFVIITLIQWAIIGSHAKRVSLFQEFIGNKRSLLAKFSEHFKLLEEEKFSTPQLKNIAFQSMTAKEQLKVLAARSRALDLRLNLFATLILNSTLLYDLWCVLWLEQWREKNRSNLEQWLMAICEADALASLGTYVFNHPDFVFPEVTSDARMSAKELGHPLIAHEHRVCNDIEMNIDSHVWIVTGANMAGKSTFLRTIGINTVLALAGMPVCAQRMICPLTEVFTGMRNTDSINDNQSYFFAELLRLQKIIGQLRQGKRLLILLDEILKGTNSIDKLSGSEELIKQFVNQHCLIMIATHDVALGEMSKQYPEVRNYHFETFIKGDELTFDYKLKPGVSTGKNATFLMKKMGIIGEPAVNR